MKNKEDVFDSVVFNNIEKGFMKKKRIAFAHSEGFEQNVYANMLKFDSLKRVDTKVKISNIPNGYTLTLSKPHIAFDLRSIIGEDNNVNLTFSENYFNFEPDEELIYKSSVPLWVIQPVSSNKVCIKRMW